MNYFIVAGNHAQYLDFCKEYDLDRREYRYVVDRYTLVGYDDVEVYYVGTYSNRKDLNDIMEYAQTRRRVTPYSFSDPVFHAWSAVHPSIW